MHFTCGEVKRKPISPLGEVADGKEGVGGGHTTEEARTTQPCGGKDPYFVHKLKGGKS